MSTAAEPRGEAERLGAFLREIGRSVLGAFTVVGSAARLLAAHWPVLVTVLLLGALARELALWGSFELSKVSPVGATLTVALAPLASVVALILALRAVLPSLGHVPDSGGVDRSRQLAILASALVPFLAVYAAQGYLREDTRRFVNETYADEYLTTNWFLGESADGRTWADSPVPVVVAVVVIALVLRWGLDRFGLAERNLAWGFLAGWVEALWLVTVAKTVSTGWSDVWSWVQGRQGVRWIIEGWEWVVSVLGPVGAGIQSALTWVLQLLGDFDTLVVVPLAWLAVGAVVYGRELATPPTATDLSAVRQRLVGSIQDERVEQGWAAARERAAAARRRAKRVPGWLRTWVLAPVTSITDRFAALGTGLLRLVRAGLVPMVTLCLVLILARHAGVVVADLLRRIIGPMDPELGGITATGPETVLSLVTTLLMVVLIAAAVDRFLVEEGREADAATSRRSGGQANSARTS